MIELFTDLTAEEREYAENSMKIIFQKNTTYDIIKAYQQLYEACCSERQKNFFNFLFELKLEELNNESSASIR